MRRVLWIVLAAAASLVTLVIVAVLLIAQGALSLMLAVASDVPYPAVPPLPPPVSESTESLLAKYEVILSARSPALLEALRPGLSDDAIDALERTNQCKLPGDLRALYRWHDGTTREAHLNAFPGHRFVPITEAFTDRSAHASIGYRKAWLGLIVDAARDGYFFDPDRAASPGSFFFCFAEDGSYVFFAAFRNYVAAVVQGYDDGTFSFDASGAQTTDFERAHALWQKFGAQPPQQ